MVTKTDESKEREIYKQGLLHCSTWRLRKTGIDAGVPTPILKEAEAKGSTDGPKEMIELILEKYDAGWRPNGEALNVAAKPPKTEPAKKRKSKAKEEEAEVSTETEKTQGDGEEDLWDQAVAEGTDEDLLSDLGLDNELEEEPMPPDADVTMSAAPAAARATEEVSGLEDKVDQIQDLLTDVASAVLEASDKLKTLEARITEIHLRVVEHKEVAVRAWALLCKKMGVSNLSLALKKGAEKAESIVLGNGK